jgi:hypothetical protein
VPTKQIKFSADRELCIKGHSFSKVLHCCKLHVDVCTFLSKTMFPLRMRCLDRRKCLDSL